jgi:hypothetical protein
VLFTTHHPAHSFQAPARCNDGRQPTLTGPWSRLLPTVTDHQSHSSPWTQCQRLSCMVSLETLLSLSHFIPCVYTDHGFQLLIKQCKSLAGKKNLALNPNTEEMLTEPFRGSYGSRLHGGWGGPQRRPDLLSACPLP